MVVAETYVNGVSTRKVKVGMEKLGGVSISSAQVSKAAVELDEILQAWRDRPLGRIEYLYLDARYEHIREGGVVQDEAVFIAVGVDTPGKRSVLGVSVD